MIPETDENYKPNVFCSILIGYEYRMASAKQRHFKKGAKYSGEKGRNGTFVKIKLNDE